MNFKIYILIVFGLYSSSAVSQVYKKMKFGDDTIQIKKLLDRADKVKPDSGLAYAYESLSLSRQRNWNPGVALSLKQLGSIYYDSNQPDSAYYYNQQALSLFKKLNDKNNTAIVLNEMGIIWGSYRKNLDSCTTYFQMALDIFTALKNEIKIANGTRNLGIVCMRNDEYKKAMGYFLLSQKSYEKLKDTLMLASNYSSLSLLNTALDNYEKAIYYHNKWNELNKIKKIMDTAYSNLLLADIYAKNNELDTALKIFENNFELAYKSQKEIYRPAINYRYAKLLYLSKEYFKGLKYLQKDHEINLKYNLTGNEQTFSGLLGKYYLQIAQLPEDSFPNDVDSIYRNKNEMLALAVSNLQKEIEGNQSSKQLGGNIGLLQELSKAYELQKQYAAAFAMYKQAVQIKDSLDNINKKDSILRLLLNYEFEKKKDSLSAEQKLQQLQLEKKTELAQLKFEFDKKRIAAKSEEEKKLLLKEEEIKKAQIEEKYKARQQVLELEKKQNLLAAAAEKKQQALKLKQQRQSTFFIVLSVLVIAITGLIFFYSRQKRLRTSMALAKAQSDLKAAEYSSKLNDITYSALLSQMNPHFIFNCLNSIKLYNQENNKELANNFLDKFSGLIRKTLENSRADKITLSEEVDTLTLYLQLEAMRFKEKLKWAIDVDDNADELNTEIPPMLIQPYIENAIWHGLMNKEAGGTVSIHFSFKDDNYLQVIIADDGVGRIKSAAINRSRMFKPASVGTAITKDRFDLIKQKYNRAASIHIDDLYGHQGEPAGTKVTLLIPIL